MKRVLTILILSSVFVFSSGFGAVENNSYVQTETVSSKKLVVKVELNSSSESSNPNLESGFEKAAILDTSESFSDKIGVFIVESFISVLQHISSFLLTLVH